MKIKFINGKNGNKMMTEEINPSELLKKQKLLKYRQAFTMANVMVFSDLWKNVLFTKFILPTDGHIGCAKRDT